MKGVNFFNINGSIGENCYGATDFANVDDNMTRKYRNKTVCTAPFNLANIYKANRF